MATENQVQANTKIAVTTIPAFRAVVVTGEQADGNTTAGLTPDASACNGVSGMGVEGTADEPQAFPMNYAGEVKIESFATLVAGVLVSADSSGRAIAEAAAGNVSIGTVVFGGVAGDIISIAFDVQRIHA